MALTEDEMKGVLNEFDEIAKKAAEVADDVRALKKKLKKEEKDTEKKAE